VARFNGTLFVAVDASSEAGAVRCIEAIADFLNETQPWKGDFTVSAEVSEEIENLDTGEVFESKEATEDELNY